MHRSFRYSLLVVALCITAAFLIVAHHAAHPGQQVLITFEGPWAFAADPDDASSIFAFAPKTTTHHDLAVRYSNDKSSEAPLAAGVYEVLLHAAPVVRNRTAIDSKILQAKIDAQGVQHALHARLERYAIRLPRPEAYVSTSAGRMRAGTAYPPGPSTENDYAMSVSLRYRASTLAGFRVVGTPDEGIFHPLPVETPNLSFAIQPLEPRGQMDECEMHNREAFRDLAKLVNLKMFVDFGEFASACREHDPQKPPA
jgi:hypothetical protein